MIMIMIIEFNETEHCKYYDNDVAEPEITVNIAVCHTFG